MRKVLGLLVIVSLAGCGSEEPARSTGQATGPSSVARYMVQFAAGFRAVGMAALSAAGAQVEVDLPAHNAVAVSLPAAALNSLKNHPAVALIEVDPLREPSAFDLASQRTPYGISMVQATQVSYGSPRKVCIIDSGYDGGHPDLPHGANVAGDLDPRSGTWSLDRCGHGTHVAGTIAALNNTEGVLGVLPGGTVDLYIVKVFGTDRRNSCSWAYSSDLIAAADRCRSAGANVISMSLGGSGSSTIERNAFAQLYADGMLSIAAAGNGGNTAYSYPASYPSVISVAAIDSAKQKASFSQSNDQVELSAPGVDVESTIPLSCAYCPKKGSTGYASWDGTSMATPHVSGVAALIWSAAPARTAVEVRAALQAGAEHLGSPGRNNQHGFGLVRAAAALQCLTDPASCPAPGCSSAAQCDDGDACTIDSCDASSGRCSYAQDSSDPLCAAPTCLGDGASCSASTAPCCEGLRCLMNGSGLKCR